MRVSKGRDDKEGESNMWNLILCQCGEFMVFTTETVEAN